MIEEEKVIYEYITVYNASFKGNKNERDTFLPLLFKMNEILKFNGKIDEISSVKVTTRQIFKLNDIRNNELFIELMGRKSLENKIYLEHRLDYTFPKVEDIKSDSYISLVIASIELEEKLNSLLVMKSITEEEFKVLSRDLDYIFNYLIFVSHNVSDAKLTHKL